MRIYLPATAEILGREFLEAELAFGPTSELKTALAEYDPDEELVESVAMDLAAMASLRLLTESQPPRRVVIAADADATPVREGALGQVRVDSAVNWENVVSIHLDGAEQEELVKQCLASDDEELLGRLEAEPLEWFDISEREYLVKHFAG